MRPLRRRSSRPSRTRFSAGSTTRSSSAALDLTLADYRYLLAAPGTPARRRGRAPSCRIMRSFGSLPLASITAADVGRYLAELDAEPSVGPRTVNKHRQVLCCVFEHAMREDTFGLAVNPARRTDKRREPDLQPIDFYEPEEVLALVRAARAGRHRDPSRPAVSPDEHAERDRCDEQDAAIFVVAAFTGLRMGELVRRRPHLAQVTQDALGAVRRPAGLRPRAARGARTLHGPRRPRVLQLGRRVPRRLGAAATTVARRTLLACARSASTTCATRSAAS